MTYNSKLIQRVDKLISDSEAVLRTVKQPGPNVIAEAWVDDEAMAQLRASA